MERDVVLDHILDVHHKAKLTVEIIRRMYCFTEEIEREYEINKQLESQSEMEEKNKDENGNEVKNGGPVPVVSDNTDGENRRPKRKRKPMERYHSSSFVNSFSSDEDYEPNYKSLKCRECNRFFYSKGHLSVNKNILLLNLLS